MWAVISFLATLLGIILAAYMLREYFKVKAIRTANSVTKSRRPEEYLAATLLSSGGWQSIFLGLAAILVAIYMPWRIAQDQFSVSNGSVCSEALLELRRALSTYTSLPVTEDGYVKDEDARETRFDTQFKLEDVYITCSSARVDGRTILTRSEAPWSDAPTSTEYSWFYTNAVAIRDAAGMKLAEIGNISPRSWYDLYG